MLEIENLHVQIEDKPILKGLNLKISPGEIHVLMGPNGAGKSTLAKVLAGHPDYVVTEGKILFEGKDILELEPEERVHLGLFLTFQYPVEVPGVTNKEFLYQSYLAQKKARNEAAPTQEEFEQTLSDKLANLQMSPQFLKRSVNEGFSGGEKKRNEILQMNLFEPKLCILDETDSGLDIDSMKIVAKGINSQMDPKRAFLLITHYQRLLDYVKPDHIHVLIDGKITYSGGAELALKLEAQGYDWLIGKTAV